MFGGDAADLMCASNAVAGATLAYYHEQFERALADTIAHSPLMNFCAVAGISPTDVAKALHATSRGLKQSCTSRQEFGSTITAAVRMFCAPLSLIGPLQE
jgi:hypothetical protein